jgi:hypothetical protein
MGSVEGSPKGFTTVEKTFMDKVNDVIYRIKAIDFIGKIKDLNEKYDSVPEPWKFAIAMAIGGFLLLTKKAMIILVPAVLIARSIRSDSDKNEHPHDNVREIYG